VRARDPLEEMLNQTWLKTSPARRQHASATPNAPPGANDAVGASYRKPQPQPPYVAGKVSSPKRRFVRRAAFRRHGTTDGAAEHKLHGTEGHSCPPSSGVTGRGRAG